MDIRIHFNVKTISTFLIFYRRLICQEKCTFRKKLTMEIICAYVDFLARRFPSAKRSYYVLSPSLLKQP